MSSVGQTDNKVNNHFSIKRKLRVTVDLDLNWNNLLANEPDIELDAKLQHLIDNPLLLNKLFGLNSLQYLQDYFSDFHKSEKYPDYYSSDIFLAGNYAYMTNEEIFDELIYQVNGYEEASIYDILSTQSFNISVKGIGVNDLETGTKFDLGPIPDPMILERGGNYMIGHSKDELMVAITQRLKGTDTFQIKKNCEHVIDRTKKYVSEMGYKLAWLAVYIITPIKETKTIEEDLRTFFKEEHPKINPRIIFEEVDGFINLKDISPWVTE